MWVVPETRPCLKGGVVLTDWLPFRGGAHGKEPACNAGNARDVGSIPGSGRSPGGINGNPLQDSCLKNPVGKGLAGCSPWGRKEPDTTERLSTSLIKIQPKSSPPNTPSSSPAGCRAPVNKLLGESGFPLDPEVSPQEGQGSKAHSCPLPPVHISAPPRRGQRLRLVLTSPTPGSQGSEIAELSPSVSGEEAPPRCT